MTNTKYMNPYLAGFFLGLLLLVHLLPAGDCGERRIQKCYCCSS